MKTVRFLATESLYLGNGVRSRRRQLDVDTHQRLRDGAWPWARHWQCRCLHRWLPCVPATAAPTARQIYQLRP